MALPSGDRVLSVLSPGPAVRVLLVAGADGAKRVVKQAAIARAVASIQREAAALRALERATVDGVPRVRSEWDWGIALEWFPLGTLAQGAARLRGDAVAREQAVRSAFARLETVHAAGVLHGDLAPGNVLLSGDGARAALVDFGLAQLGGDARDGAFRGTISYAAPELARGEPIDARADRFALAACLLHVVTGRPLRAIDGRASLASLLATAGSCEPLDATHPWRRLAPALFPPTMADALLQALAADPRDRPRAGAW